MKKRLNAGFLWIAAIAISVTAICSMSLFYNILINQIFDDLRANAHVVAALGADGLPQDIGGELSDDSLRITVVNPFGQVLYESQEKAPSMENHKGRPEIAQALSSGEGRDMRRSATSAQHTFYYAIRMEDGSVLRIGKESGSIYRLVCNMAAMAVVIGVGVFLLCFVYAHRLTGRLMEPVERMADDLAHVDVQEVYEEMRPFVSMIKKQHVDILNNAQMRQEFTANVSHELKTPLTAISGYAELIAGGIAGEADTKHFAGEIHRSAERLQSLINDIIKLSELDDRSRTFEIEPIDLYVTGEHCLALMELQAQKNEVFMYLMGEHVCINGNRTLIDELLYNLCSNAVRYNKKGGTVTIRVQTDCGHPVLCVKDTGIGIPKDQQDRVFERFYRVDKSRSKSSGGTGLGLAIVKHIVAQHNAQISLKSEEGIGTEIKIVF